MKTTEMIRLYCATIADAHESATGERREVTYTGRDEEGDHQFSLGGRPIWLSDEEVEAL